MYRNHLLVALRRIRRQPGYSSLNILGLAVGLACSFFILLAVYHQTSVDRFHEKTDDLYRIMRSVGDDAWNSVQLPLAQAMESQIPEVAHVLPLTWGSDLLVTTGETSFREQGRFAGPEFFEMFSYPLIEGDAATILGAPTSAAISESMAERMFGTDWREQHVIGQPLSVDGRAGFQVSGVFADISDLSSIAPDLLLSIADYEARNAWLDSWQNSGLQLLVELKPGASADVVNAKIAGMLDANREEVGQSQVPFLHPYGDMYLYTEFDGTTAVGGVIGVIRVFLIVALFLLAIAAINFMNLATARSGQRVREIGVRKAIGAAKASVAGQFLLEAVLLSLLALAVALLIVALSLPAFSEVTGLDFAFAQTDPRFWMAGAVIAVVIGLIAGSYPAVYLSSFRPAVVLRGAFRQGRGARWARKGLVVFQFALSTLLIVGTLTVYLQMNYIQTKDMGLDRSDIVLFRVEGGAQQQWSSFRQSLEEQPGIASVSATNQNPLSVSNSTNNVQWEGKPDGDVTNFYLIHADYDFIETMRMQVVAGRTFLPDFASDSSGVIVNQQMAEHMGMEDPVGQPIHVGGIDGQIVGVVADFHMTSVQRRIEPTAILLNPERAHLATVRVEPGQARAGLASIQSLLTEFNPGLPFDYSFLDERFEAMYRLETITSVLSRLFAIVGLFVAAMGLFGLAAFTSEQRRKEVGVRKVLGASVPGLVGLLTRDFVLLVVIAFVAAVPLAYVVMDAWLDGFAYRVDLGVALFAIAGGALVTIALLTVGVQAVRAAVADPVRALRSE